MAECRIALTRIDELCDSYQMKTTLMIRYSFLRLFLSATVLMASSWNMEKTMGEGARGKGIRSGRPAASTVHQRYGEDKLDGC